MLTLRSPACVFGASFSFFFKSQGKQYEGKNKKCVEWSLGTAPFYPMVQGWVNKNRHTASCADKEHN